MEEGISAIIKYGIAQQWEKCVFEEMVWELGYPFMRSLCVLSFRPTQISVQKSF